MSVGYKNLANYAWFVDENGLRETSDKFSKCLLRNNCVMSFISGEWISLLHHIIATAADSPKKHYLNTCSRMFMSFSVKDKWKNVLYVIEILLYTPFTNAKIERRFSQTVPVKSDSMLLDKWKREVCYRCSNWIVVFRQVSDKWIYQA